MLNIFFVIKKIKLNSMPVLHGLQTHKKHDLNDNIPSKAKVLLDYYIALSLPVIKAQFEINVHLPIFS